MEKNMENDMEIGGGVTSGFIGMMTNIMVPYSLYNYSIWYLTK